MENPGHFCMEIYTLVQVISGGPGLGTTEPPIGLLHSDKVHMVKADAEAMTVLSLAATKALSCVTPQDRSFLDRVLARQARSLAWRRDAGRLMPVLA